MPLFVVAASLVVLQGSFAIKASKAISGPHVIAVAPAPIGNKILASFEDNSIRIIDPTTSGVVKILGNHPQWAYGLAWSPNGKIVATGDESARIWFWDVATGKKIKEIRPHIKGIQCLAFNKTGTVLLSTAKDDTVKSFTVPDGKPIMTILGKGLNLYSAKFTPDDKSIEVATLGGGAQIYSASGAYKATVGPKEFASWDIELNRTATKLIVAGREGSIKVYDFAKKVSLAEMKGHEDWVINAEMSPNGKYLATSSNDRTVRIWDLSTYKQVAQINDQTFVGAPICFSADGKYLITTNANDQMQINLLATPQGATPVPVTRKKSRRKK